jgi:putative tryptophan/tyrosine transport system substrate-binding protein
VTPAGAPIGLPAAQRNPNTETDVRDALAAAQTLKRTLHVEKVPADGDVEAGFGALLERRIGALFVAPQADFRMWLQQLVMLAPRHALPTSFSSSDYVTAGGLMSYGPDQIESYREGAVYTGRLLKGERPAELPVVAVLQVADHRLEGGSSLHLAAKRTGGAAHLATDPGTRLGVAP